MARRRPTVAPVVESSEPVSYHRSFPGQWPGLEEYVYAAVEPHHGMGGWLASCQLSLPNDRREQWNTTRRFESREDAASYAAAFIIEAERILAAIEAGGEPYMPHRAMREECLRALYQASDRASSVDECAWYRARDFRDYVLTFELSQEAA